MNARSDRVHSGSIARSLVPWQQTHQRAWAVFHTVRTSVILLWAIPVAVVTGLMIHGVAGLLLWLAVLVLWAAWCVLEARREAPLAYVAEMLDEQADTRNLIASALQFEEKQSSSLFEQATVLSGANVLAGLKGFQMKPLPWSFPWRQLLLVCALTAGLMLIPGNLGARAMQTQENHAVGGGGDAPLESAEGSSRETASIPVAQATRAEAASVNRLSSESPRNGSPASAADSSSGSGSQQGSGASTQAQSLARKMENRQTSASEADEQPSDPARESSSSKASSSSEQGAGASSRHASASGSGKGKGSASSVSHDWKSNVSAASTDRSTTDDVASEEDEQDPDQDQQQRGGAQPAARDRNVAPSRQLGISGPKGPPGAGRGGPTPIKKSRGTSAMLLGVPVPELVEGQPRSGPVKRTFRQVKPTPQVWENPGALSASGQDSLRDDSSPHSSERETRLIIEYLNAMREQVNP